MDSPWRPIAELRPGHYAVGLCTDGHEINIYRAGEGLVNVVTGEEIDGVEGVSGWRVVNKSRCPV